MITYRTYRTYKTEDGHTKADCPKCEGSEHIDILEEDGQCEACSVEWVNNHPVQKIHADDEDIHGEIK